MSITDMRMANESILRLMKDQIVLWDRYAEALEPDLTLWVPGVDGVYDGSASSSSLSTSTLGNSKPLETNGR